MAEKLAFLSVLCFFCLIFFIAGYVWGYERASSTGEKGNG